MHDAVLAAEEVDDGEALHAAEGGGAGWGLHGGHVGEDDCVGVLGDGGDDGDAAVLARFFGRAAGAVFGEAVVEDCEHLEAGVLCGHPVGEHVFSELGEDDFLGAGALLHVGHAFAEFLEFENALDGGFGEDSLGVAALGFPAVQAFAGSLEEGFAVGAEGWMGDVVYGMVADFGHHPVAGHPIGGELFGEGLGHVAGEQE